MGVGGDGGLDRVLFPLTRRARQFAAAREGRLHRRGGQRRRWPGAGRSERLTLRDRLLVTPAWLHDEIAVKTEGIDSLLDACFTGRRQRGLRLAGRSGRT